MVAADMRLDNRISAATRIEVVTEGVFARMILDDPELTGVSVVIFDEFHERSLDADFGLALALDVQSALREDLRILVMSATLDVERVAALLDHPPVIESLGRSFPIDIRYQDRPGGERIEDAVTRTILDAHAGDLLVIVDRPADRGRDEGERDIGIHGGHIKRRFGDDGADRLDQCLLTRSIEVTGEMADAAQELRHITHRCRRRGGRAFS